MINLKYKKYRLQIVFPTVTFKKSFGRVEFNVQAQTIFRISYGDKGKEFWLIGFSILGFGIGIDYDKTEECS